MLRRWFGYFRWYVDAARLDDISIYDGSLLDWAADPALPMETM